MASQTRGTMLLRFDGRFYKVLKVLNSGGNNFTFKCKDFDSKEDKTLHFNMSGFLEAADQAFKVMKSPKDIFFLDLDRNGEWKVINEDNLKQA